MFSTAISGTATSAPMMPASTTPAAIPMITASGWMATARPMISGCSTCPSSCCTPITTPRMISAVTGPLSTSATSTATAPERVAPTIGMNAPRKTSAASGNANGTSKMTRKTPMPTASMKATSTVART